MEIGRERERKARRVGWREKGGRKAGGEALPDLDTVPPCIISPISHSVALSLH